MITNWSYHKRQKHTKFFIKERILRKLLDVILPPSDQVRKYEQTLGAEVLII